MNGIVPPSQMNRRLMFDRRVSKITAKEKIAGRLHAYDCLLPVWSIIASVNWSGQQCGRSILPSVQPQHFDSSESAGDFQAEERSKP